MWFDQQWVWVPQPKIGLCWCKLRLTMLSWRQNMLQGKLTQWFQEFPGFVEVQQLAIPNDLKTNKEEAFIQQVLRIGEFMNVPLTELFLHTIGKKTTVWRFVLWQSVFLRTTRPNFWLVSVFAKELNFSKRLAKFWDAFQRYYPNHPVLTMAISFVHACLSNFTAMRERAFAAQAFINLVGGQSCMRTFPACLATFSGPVWAMKLTKKLTQGLRKAMRCLMNSANTLHGRQLKFTGKGLMQATWAGFIWLLCLMRVTCQRKPGHTTPKRNFNCSPNQMCPWCLANDTSVPYTDVRDCALWRSTVATERPWTNESPLHAIPGANHEFFLAKDVFHIFHLGAIRTFVVNLLCLLVYPRCLCHLDLQTYIWMF